MWKVSPPEPARTKRSSNTSLVVLAGKFDEDLAKLKGGGDLLDLAAQPKHNLGVVEDQSIHGLSRCVGCLEFYSPSLALFFRGE